MATEAQKRAAAKYKSKNWKKICIELPAEEFEIFEKYLERTGETKAGFLRKIIKDMK